MRARLWFGSLLLGMVFTMGGCVSQEEAQKSVEKMATQWGGNNYSVEALPLSNAHRFLVCTANGKLLYVVVNTEGFDDVDEIYELDRSNVKCVDGSGANQVKSSPNPSYP